MTDISSQWVRPTRKKPSAIDHQRRLERLFGGPPHWRMASPLMDALYWCCRELQYWFCYYDDVPDIEIDVEDLLVNPFNTQPPSLDDLQRRTGFRKQWLMFIYRNFKQRCSNGRMSISQWRHIFRLIFPNTTDSDFADRIFDVIANGRSPKLVTFENMIMCLHDLTIQSAHVHSLCSNGSVEHSKPVCEESSQTDRSSGDIAVDTQWSHRNSADDHSSSAVDHQSVQTSSPTIIPPTRCIAQFAFKLMQPDEKGRIDLNGFTEYTRSVFSLNASPHRRWNDSVFGQIQHVTSSNAAVHSSAPSDLNLNHIRQQAKDRFTVLDTDNDGFITLGDLENCFRSIDIRDLMLTTEGSSTEL